MLLKNTWFCTTVLTWLLITASSLPGDSAFAATYPLTVNGSVRQGAIPHFWSECVGTGAMDFCLKPAWQIAARIGAQEAGFKRVRGHAILIDYDNADHIRLGSGPNWNFSVIDQIFDTVIACGMRPLVELSFMPKSLQNNGATHSPPNSYDAWKSFIAALISHLETRFGVAEVRTWYFEVWNEPDYAGFWTGTMNDYYTLFNNAAAGARSVDTNILIGGPAATNPSPLQGFWNSCNSNGIKFLSDHTYGNGSSNNFAVPANMRDDNRTRSDVIKSTGKNLFSLNTEYNSSYSGQGGSTAPNCISMDSHRNAPFIAKTVKLIIDDCISGKYRYPDVFSYWAISDCFDEGGDYIENHSYVPFAEVFGLINYQGIRKAAFNAFKMLNMMGTTGLSVTGGSNDADGIDGFATVNTDSSQVAILIYSYYNDLTSSGADNTVNLVINHLPFANGQQLTVYHYRVDSLHSNPYGVWKRLGSPASPSTAQWDSLRAHQILEQIETPSTVTYTGAAINKSFAMSRWSVSLLTISRGATGTMLSGGTRLESPLLSIRGAVLTVSSRLHGPVMVFVYGPNGRLIKQVRSLQRSVDLGAGLSKGMYVALAEAAGIRLMKKIAVY